MLSWAPVQLEDTWFYAATGRWVVDNHAIPRTDPFSWTVAGQPWQSNGWLWGVLLWIVWSIGGMAAIAFLKPIYVVVSGLATRWSATTLGATPNAAMVGALGGIAATFPFLVERPQLASFVAAPLCLGVTHRVLTLTRWWPWLVALMLLFAVWTNLHSVALTGVVLVAALAAGRVIDQRRARSLRAWLAAAGVTVAAAVGTLVNPWGIELWTHGAEVRRVSKGAISEWAALWDSGTGGWVGLALVIAAVATALRLGGLRRLELLAPLLVAAGFAVDAIRAFPVFAVVAAAVLPPLFPARSPLSSDRLRLLTVGAVTALAIAIVISLPRVASTSDPADATPVGPVAALPSGCRLLNDYAFGNWIMFDRPDVPVSDDGRNDLYGRDDERELLIRDPDIAAGLPAWANERQVDCVLLEPTSPAVDVLLENGWRVAGEDGTAVALVAP
jgi:hypothetical protein